MDSSSWFIQAHRRDLRRCCRPILVAFIADQLLDIVTPGVVTVGRQQIACPLRVAGHGLTAGAGFAHRDVVGSHLVGVVDALHLIGREVPDPREAVVTHLLTEHVAVELWSMVVGHGARVPGRDFLQT